MKRMKKLKHRYSGVASCRFWNYVNALEGEEHAEMYSLGVALQNHEEYVLRQLSHISRSWVKKEKQDGG